jgi:hypothetical protein
MESLQVQQVLLHSQSQCFGWICSVPAASERQETIDIP